MELALNGYSEQCLVLYSKLKPVKQAIQLAQKIPYTYVVSGGAQTELNHVFKEHQIANHFQEILGSPITKPEHLKYLFEQTGIEKENIVTKKLADKYKLAYVDNYNLIPSEEKYFVDSIHFSPEGMKSIATNFYSEISKNF